MNKNNMRRQFFANQLHRDMCWLFFFASVIPAFITAISLFYLIFSIMAEQLVFPEAIAANIIPAAKKVLVVLCVAIPLSILLILKIAHKVTHRIVGPFDRIVRELGECIEGTKQGHIKLRPGDTFWPLVDKINILLDKINR